MPDIDHARRDILQAAYTPIAVAQRARGLQGIEKRGLVAWLHPTAAEVTSLRKKIEAASPALYELLHRWTSANSAADARSASHFAAIDADAFVTVAEHLVEHRIRHGEAVLDAKRHVENGLRTPSAPREAVLVAPDSARDGETPASEPPASAVVVSSLLRDWADWASRREVKSALSPAALDLAARLSLEPELATSGALARAISMNVESNRRLIHAFTQRLAAEPIGLLHLERLTFTPAGVERGELVHSLPLAPGEEVNVTHKEWSATSEEFEKIVTDFLEDFSEEGVAEKSEAAMATSSQVQHGSALDTGVTASGGYGPVTIAASVGYSVTDATSKSEEFSRNQSLAVTRKASSRAKMEHKITFKVVSSSGTEDQSVRRIKNPFEDRTTRVDYYQLIRKWRIDLYRYGVRLTYDLAIPEPGAGILSKIKEARRLQEALGQGFDAPGAPGTTDDWTRFDLTPAQITRGNYTEVAARYRAAVPQPPRAFKDYTQFATHAWRNEDESKQPQFFALEVDVDVDYEIDRAEVNKNFMWHNEAKHIFGHQPLNDYLGKSGKYVLIYQTRHLASLYVELKIRARVTDEVYRGWQLKVWSVLRDAAQARYFEQRQRLKDRLAQLTAELGAQDALSLRKIEREEVMKGVLAWLFGPSFAFAPDGLPDDLTGAGGSVVSQAIWGQVLANGEMIKFLHQAIEWENMIYFLYPYFWSHASRWELKKYLDHPDAMHRAFLKAGSARVVLTIRPGFERAFVCFLETGTFDELPGDHPYMKIAEEVQSYARTNYPGIPPANPEEADATARGKRIGTWYEYTPTSAMDIAFNETLPES